MKEPLDEKRIEQLSVVLLEPIRANFHRGPTSRDRVYEALNALAFVTATVLQGAGDEAAYDFWQRALAMQLAELEKSL